MDDAEKTWDDRDAVVHGQAVRDQPLGVAVEGDDERGNQEEVFSHREGAALPDYRVFEALRWRRFGRPVLSGRFVFTFPLGLTVQECAGLYPYPHPMPSIGINTLRYFSRQSIESRIVRCKVLSTCDLAIEKTAFFDGVARKLFGNKDLSVKYSGIRS